MAKEKLNKNEQKIIVKIHSVSDDDTDDIIIKHFFCLREFFIVLSCFMCEYIFLPWNFNTKLLRVFEMLKVYRWRPLKFAFKWPLTSYKPTDTKFV